MGKPEGIEISQKMIDIRAGKTNVLRCTSDCWMLKQQISMKTFTETNRASLSPLGSCNIPAVVAFSSDTVLQTFYKLVICMYGVPEHSVICQYHWWTLMKLEMSIFNIYLSGAKQAGDELCIVAIEMSILIWLVH